MLSVWLHVLTQMCVDGFVLISGYFGIRFGWRKMLALYAVAGFYALAGVIGLTVLRSGEIVFSDVCVRTVLAVAQKYWFLHAYVGLMMLAPLINKFFSDTVVERRDDQLRLAVTVAPLLFLCFGWSWIYSVSGRYNVLVPHLPGMGSHTWLTLLGIYVVGRFCRVCRLDQFCSRRLHLAIILVVSLILSLAGRGRFAQYNNPLVVLMTLSAFILFLRTKSVPAPMDRILVFVSRSMFPVYLIHMSPFGREVMLGFGQYRQEHFSTIALSGILMALVVFFACVLIDLPRRCFLMSVTSLSCCKRGDV